MLKCTTPRGAWLAATALSLAALIAVPLLQAQAQDAARRNLLNAWEVHEEISVAPEKAAAVQQFFPSFLEYQDMVMFHPTVGYYSSGRVDFHSHYQTFPMVLSPYFGQMAAEQIFKIWRGMRAAGTLAPDERFTIAEFGAGDGTMAESILDYLVSQREKSSGGSDSWREFVDQTVYVCYDRSPALSKKQRERNERFGERFAAREADATDPLATIPAGSLKGVFLSNELPDAFSVHKVMLSADGDAEVAFVVPTLDRSRWIALREKVQQPVAEVVENGDRAIKEAIFSSEGQWPVYLNREAFVALLGGGTSPQEHSERAHALSFRELYLPVEVIPELAAHLDRYADLYAGVLAKKGRGMVTYINLGVEKYLHGAAEILSAGYVFTLDYGATWEGILSQDSHPHLRTYGPANASSSYDPYYEESYYESGYWQYTYDPYIGPTLNDLTTDVNFSLMAAEGELVGLKTLYYGAQWALQTGTGIVLDAYYEDGYPGAATFDEFSEWARYFETDPNYRLMVQQKQNTDDAYVYPNTKPDPLNLHQAELSEDQKAKAESIAARLRAARQSIRPSSSDQPGR